MAAKSKSSDRLWANRWRILLWGAAEGVLLIPLIAMQFTDEVQWDLFDFVFMGGLIGLCGLGVELAVRASANTLYRLGAIVAAGTSFLLVWANAAVQIFGDGDNPRNLWVFAVIGVAVAGGAMTKLRPAGMARAMFAAAAAQAAFTLLFLVAGLTSPGPQGLREAALSIGGFGALWLLAGGLFRKAASPGP